MAKHSTDYAKGKNEVWFQGDKARFTGKVETLYGGTFGEAKIVSSGKTVLIALKHATTNQGVDDGKSD